MTDLFGVFIIVIFIALWIIIRGLVSIEEKIETIQEKLGIKIK